MRYFEKRNLIIGSGSVTIGVIGHGINAGFILKEFENKFDKIIDYLRISYSRGLKPVKYVRTLKKNVYETRVKESEDLKKLEYYKHQVKDQDFGYGKIGRFNKIDNNFSNFDAEFNSQITVDFNKQVEQDLKRHFFICINAKKINEEETLTELISLTSKEGLITKKVNCHGKEHYIDIEAFNFGKGVSQAYVGYKYEIELNNEKFKEALFLGKKGINEGKKGLMELEKKIEKDESLINDIKTCGVIKEGIFFKYSDKINLDEINIVNIEK